jgi:hypothetical protein
LILILGRTLAMVRDKEIPAQPVQGVVTRPKPIAWLGPGFTGDATVMNTCGIGHQHRRTLDETPCDILGFLRGWV